jgi:multidrug efflux pump subunit AcrB
MKALISLCVRRPVTIIMILTAVIAASVFALTVLPLERLPELSVPRVSVETVYPGMAANDIRSLVTIPVEDALSPVKGTERIRSVSRDNRSLVIMDFRWGTDPVQAAVLVREAIDAVYPALPDGVHKPAVSPGDPASEPHAIIAVRSLNGDGSFARKLAEYELRARLRKIDGIGSIILVGGEQAEERLRLDTSRLAALGMSPPEFARLVAGETADIPAGNAREGDRELVVVSSGRPASAGELADVVLPFAQGAFRVRDAGELGYEPGRRESIFVFDGNEAAALEIYRRSGADPVRLSKEIQKVLNEAAPFFSRDAEISLVMDSTPVLLKSITSLMISAALGAAAVIAVLLVFIRRLRYSLLAALSIPVSAAAGICVLALAGKSLNSMSLGGLALGIGLVSDTGVIMLDLLHRAFGGCLCPPAPEETGGKAASIAGSSVASTLTTAVVFVPVMFLPGPLGALFGDTALALTASISAGWLYAQFCLPSLYRFFYKMTPKVLNDKHGSFGAADFERGYRKLLARTLRRPMRVFAAAVSASALGAMMLFLKPAVFINSDDSAEVIVSVVFPPGTLLESVAGTGTRISRSISALPFLESVYGRAGAEEEDLNPRAGTDYRKEELLLHCVLVKGAKPEKALAEISGLAMRLAAAGDIPFDAGISVRFPTDKIESLLGISSGSSFVIRGKDREEMTERTGAAEKYFMDAAVPVKLRPRGTRPELRLFPDREAAAYLSVSASNIAETLYTLNEGIVASRLEVEGRPVDVRITGNGGFDENIPIKNIRDKTVFLGSLGRIERREAESALARLDRSDVMYLDVPGTDKKVLELTKNFSVLSSWFSRVDESVFSRYRNSLILNVCLVLMLLYMTMGAQFESFLLPLVLMLSIPFSLAGAGPALPMFGAGVDSGAALGLTALFGLVVNNSLILYEISNEKTGLGFSAAVAVYSGASERLRPVLITAATTVFALLPLAINPLGGSQKSMAAAMLGGLAASTLISLFALPPVFIRFFSWREKI